jgi:hypothetical protein
MVAAADGDAGRPIPRAARPRRPLLNHPRGSVLRPHVRVWQTLFAMSQDAQNQNVYADRVGRRKWDGAWRVMVTVFESIDPRLYICQPAV